MTALLLPAMLTYSCCLPEKAPEACPIIEEAWEFRLDVGACTDRQQHHCEEGLEIKQSGHEG